MVDLVFKFSGELFPLSSYHHSYPCFLVAYDPRRHQGMTLRRRWSRHLRASSPLDRRRRRIPSFTTPSETLFSPRARARGAIFSVFYFIMTLFSPHVFKRAFACLLSLSLGLWVGFPLFRDPSLRPFPFCEPSILFL